MAGLAFLGVLLEQGADHDRDLVGRDGFLEQARETRALAVAAKHQVVLARGFADEADLGIVRARATVGAAGHADDEFLAAWSSQL